MTADAHSVSHLIGREAECSLLVGLAARARGGTSGVLVLTGPAGIGKTSLLRATLSDLPGFITAAVEGVETESDLSYSALHRLLAPHTPSEQPLAEPQQQALDTVFGVRAGAPPDVFLVGLAALTVLTDAARRRPLLCVVDDVQWIDQASLVVLAFVARRLLADPIVLVFASRPGTDALVFLQGLPGLTLDALDEAAQLALVRERAPEIRPEVAQRLTREAAGNPLALGEYVRSMSSAALTGASPILDAEPLPAQVDYLFDQEIHELPDGARLLLTTAALEPSGDAILIRRSAEVVGVDLADDPERQLGRLATFEPVVRFAHPLVRAAAFRIALPGERRRIHAALAETGRDGDPIRRAWHLALALEGTDDAAATELDHAAGLARTRGGYGAECDLLGRAADLTTDPQQRDERQVRSADAALLAGRLPRAIALVASPLRSRDRVCDAKATLVRAKAAHGLLRLEEAAELFVEAAAALRGLDETGARDAWHHALYVAFSADGFGKPHLFDAIARDAAAAGLDVGRDRTVVEVLAVALVELRVGERRRGVALAHEAFATIRSDPSPSAMGIETSFGGSASAEIFDVARGRRLRGLLRARDQRAGALPSLFVMAMGDAIDAAVEGRLPEAREHMDEAAEITRAFGGDPRWASTILHPLALGGSDGEFEPRYDMLVAAARSAGMGSAFAAACSARGELLLGHARYTDAVEELKVLFALDPLDFGTRTLPALIEAAARSGDIVLARQALERLADRAEAAGSPWALGLLARSRAHLVEASEAEALHREALARLKEAQMPLDVARARLSYGEWLRRQRRRTDATEQLGIAYEELSAIGAEAYAERAKDELHAAGGRARRRTPETRDALTPQERRIAVGAASGATNREIAAATFISEATVAYHLRKIFQKLELTSRRQLRDAALT